MASAGLLRRDALFQGFSAHYRISRQGLGLIESRLPAPSRDLEIRHDVGVAWLSLAARRGTFGPLREVISERHMRSHDGSEAHAARMTRGRAQLFGVPLPGLGRGGRQRLHYPDLLLIDGDGRRIAVELELSSKGRSRRERIIGGYAADGRIDAVLYLVPDKRIAREVQAAGRRFGYEGRLQVQLARIGEGQLPDIRQPTARRPRARSAPGIARGDAKVSLRGTRAPELGL